jgi:Putative zinc-finger
MMALGERALHDEVWLLLPWLANGRLSPAERELAQEHVRHCKECERELALQQLMCSAFSEPDRVTYAPGPSFRKLMDRINGDSRIRGGEAGKAAVRDRLPAGRSSKQSTVGRPTLGRLGRVSLWRPPGLAWAASFLLLFGITGLMFTAYRWLTPAYSTVTDPSVVTPNVLHIALDRSLPIGEVEELLRTGGARIVEGPGNTGILGVTPIGVINGRTTEASANKQLRALSARLRADPRVLWVQPLADGGIPADLRAPDAADQRAPDAREH